MSETEGLENKETTEGEGQGTEGQGSTMLGKATETDEAGQEGSEASEGTEGTEGEGHETSKEKDGKTDKSEDDGAPDEYKDFAMPEGMEVDEGMMESFKPLAKELDLTQDQAQKLVDLYNESAKKSSDENQEYFGELMSEWQQDVRNDKEIGGKHFDDSLAAARSALDAFATPELYEVFEATGMGNHPEVVRVFARIGKAVKEDMIRIGGASPGAPKDPADILFPNHK